MGKTDWEAEEARWGQQIEAVVSGVRAWRAAHPRATFREIAEAIDAELNPLRAQMLAETAAMSRAARFTAGSDADRPRCAQCGEKLVGRGRRRRRVVTRGDATVELEREYGTCAACKRGVFPLDEELELGTETFDPWVTESIVLLGTVLPFERVPLVADRLLRLPVSVETARRVTERVGRTRVALEDAEADRVRATLPMPTPGPAVQQLSLDGAMVPLVGGEWAEVKTLALGEVEQTTATDGSVRTRTRALSYFSRLTDAETFRELARGELYRRGTAAAGVVCAVQDGAEWQQRFVDYHRPDAVRILDFPHGVEHVATVGRAVFGAGTAAFSTWLDDQAHTLKHGDPDAVLTTLRTLDPTTARDPEAARYQGETLAYLEKRRAQIAYADSRALGYPIGSGAVESANKLVVEARLKGSGMHWDRASVSPMVSLRDLLCSDRWSAEWPATWQAHLATPPAIAAHDPPPPPRLTRRPPPPPRRPLPPSRRLPPRRLPRCSLPSSRQIHPRPPASSMVAPPRIMSGGSPSFPLANVSRSLQQREGHPGGKIASDEYEEFGFIARNPKETGTITFKSYQTYADGETVAWVNPEGQERPASFTKITTATAGDHGPSIEQPGQAAAGATAPAGGAAGAPASGGAASSAATGSRGTSDLGLFVALGASGLALIAVALAAVSLARRPRPVQA